MIDNTNATTIEEDDFEKLLDKFINNGFEIDEGTSPNLDEGEESDDDDEETTPDLDDIDIPDGEIEQNQDLSVKVEILRPIANPREELNKLVGCADIKRRIDELVALTSYNKLMQKMLHNGKQHEVSLWCCAATKSR